MPDEDIVFLSKRALFKRNVSLPKMLCFNDVTMWDTNSLGCPHGLILGKILTWIPEATFNDVNNSVYKKIDQEIGNLQIKESG